MKQHVADANAVTVISSERVELTAEYAVYTFIFRVEEAGVYAVGVAHEGEGRVYLDDASVERDLVAEEVLAAKDDLIYQLALAEELAQSDAFTQESMDVLLKAIEDARAILASKDVTAIEVAGATTALRLAMEDLEVKPEPDPGDNPVDSSTADSSEDSSSDSSDSSFEDSSNDSSEDSSIGSSDSSIEDSSEDEIYPIFSCGASMDAGSVMALISSLLSVAFIVKAKRR